MVGTYSHRRDDMKKVSLRAAVNAKCKDCCFDPESGLGTWRQQVQGCTAVKCPLYLARPLAFPPKKPRSEEVIEVGNDKAK